MMKGKQEMGKVCFTARCFDGNRVYLMENPVLVTPKELPAFFKDCVHHHLGLNMRKRDIERFIRIHRRGFEHDGIEYVFSYD